MSKRGQGIVIPLAGLQDLLRQLKEAQGEKLTLPAEWQHDSLKVFWETCVEEGIAKWKLPSPFQRFTLWLRSLLSPSKPDALPSASVSGLKLKHSKTPPTKSPS